MRSIVSVQILLLSALRHFVWQSGLNNEWLSKLATLLNSYLFVEVPKEGFMGSRRSVVAPLGPQHDRFPRQVAAGRQGVGTPRSTG